MLNFESLLVGKAVLGMVLSLAAVAVLAQNMSGAPNWAELRPHIEMILADAEVGFSWIARSPEMEMAAK
ncbi:hypothetical protein [Pseudomonas sp. G5(2012)]|uniref:hypothetical protein n=1 Tax=Pseudomonas sp. G5(2012) TaxID=1268068 RepID=UPI00034311B4|nr:hypothetical protein PG5_00100 [Pseudomonas sp. G5(2012)]